MASPEGMASLARGFPGGSDVKASAYNAGDPTSIPRSGRSPGEGNGNPLQSWTEEPGGLQSMGSQSDTTEQLNSLTHVCL